MFFDSLENMKCFFSKEIEKSTCEEKLSVETMRRFTYFLYNQFSLSSYLNLLHADRKVVLLCLIFLGGLFSFLFSFGIF